MIFIIRFVLLFLYFVITSFISLLICLVRPFNVDNTSIIGKVYGYGILKLMGTKVHYEGRDILKNFNKPAILLANHQENYDTFLIGYLSTARTVSIGKKILIWFPLFGPIYWLAGNILIDRSNRAAALRTMDHAGERIVNENLKVLIMPEGTRSRGKGLQKFKKGAFHLAKKFDIPLIPMVLSSYAKKLDLNKIRSGEIHVKVFDPIYPQKDESIQDLAERCHRFYEKQVGLLDERNT